MTAEAFAVLALALAFAALLRAQPRRPARPVRLYELAGQAEAPVATPIKGAPGSLEVAESTWNALVEQGRALARAGAQVTPEWWAAQSSIERLAMIEGHDRAWAERATAIGTAAHGRREAAQVLSRADGGRAALDVQLDEAAERLAREAVEAPP